MPGMQSLPDGLREDFESLLRSMQERPVAVIVEGKRDLSAVGSLGFRSLFVLNKRPLFEVAEQVAARHKEAIILTDLDSEGRKLYGMLNTALQRLGVRIDNRLRQFIFRNTRIRQVEGLAALRQP